MRPKDVTLVRGKIRNAFIWSPLKREAANRFKVSPGIFKCSNCPVTGNSKEVHVDHIIPVIDPKVGFVDWNTYVARLYCDPSNLTVLCKECHRLKTNAENAERKVNKTGLWSDAARANRVAVHKGKKRSLEVRLAMSKRRKGRKCTPAQLAHLKRRSAKLCKPVLATRIIDGLTTEYPSATEAARVLKINQGNITRACNGTGGRLQARGYKFEYINKA